ncbi:MAG: hypothetical protein OSJ52_06740 [Lachnospiraceae bacterium]|nr:hypothetical protein [Lachnospiraceae bacterium]
MKQERKRIPASLLKAIGGNAWSIESMEGHGAGDRSVTYIGSRVKGYLDNDPAKGKLVADYYQDSAGEYWFADCALLPDGSLVSMEIYLFGRKLPVVRKRAKK